jgi:hypothetical protein
VIRVVAPEKAAVRTEGQLHTRRFAALLTSTAIADRIAPNRQAA